MSNKFRFELTFDKVVCYWHNERGANVDVEGNHRSERWNVSVDYLDGTIICTKEDFKSRLEEYMKNKFYSIPDFVIIEEGRLNFNQVEDNDSNELTQEEMGMMQNNKENMYLCDYNCFIKITPVLETYEPSIEELEKLLPGYEVY